MDPINLKSLTDYNPLTFPTKRFTLNSLSKFTSNSKPSSFFLQQQNHQPINLRYPLLRTNASSSSSHSFAESYLINTLGFSLESAFKASKEATFTTSQKPDSVLNFFTNWGFSNSQLHRIITTEPSLLCCNPNKRVLPKLQFLLSKGASSSDIVFIVTKTPRFLCRSLHNHIIPTYELLHSFLKSDKDTMACIIRNTISFVSSHVRPNVKLLIDCGVSESNIVVLFRKWPSIFSSPHLLKEVEEVKGLGFDPSKLSFSVALLAKHTVRNSHWDEKVDVFKKWGWSDETVVEAFRRQPNCMLASCDKIDAMMGFWVGELGWDALALVRGTNFFGFSLEKRIIPRGLVVRYLLAKGLIDKNVSLFTPFIVSEKLFLRRFVKCFEENETSYLLKLYQEKMNHQDNREDGSVQQLSKDKRLTYD